MGNCDATNQVAISWLASMLLRSDQLQRLGGCSRPMLQIHPDRMKPISISTVLTLSSEVQTLLFTHAGFVVGVDKAVDV